MPSNYICFGDNKCEQISTGIGETCQPREQHRDLGGVIERRPGGGKKTPGEIVRRAVSIPGQEELFQYHLGRIAREIERFGDDPLSFDLRRVFP